MRSALRTVLFTLSLIGLGVPTPTHAAATQPTTTAAEVATSTETEAAPAEPSEGETDQGWIGLVTLAGAAGFMILAMVLLLNLVRKRQRR